MKSKALNSLKAAQRLVEARETYGYNSSIHCSYYALLQYMKYKLATFKKNPLPYEKQDKKRRKFSRLSLDGNKESNQQSYQRKKIFRDI